MNLTIKKIRLDELEAFVNSKEFGDFEFIPITPSRARSYLNNPDGRPDDVVLYLGFTGKRLVAFRSIFAGRVNTAGQQLRFGWCSGNWVHPEFRRRGFSEQLLKEAYTDWDGKLMFTNYAPNSEKLYLKTGLFKPIHRFNGIRAYLFPKAAKLKPGLNKNPILKNLAGLTDVLTGAVSGMRVALFKKKQDPEIGFVASALPDNECYRLVQENKSVFARGGTELKWIFAHPWITEGVEDLAARYPFSAWSPSFCYKTVKLYRRDEFVGFFIFSVREGHLKTLWFSLPEEYLHHAANYLKIFCAEHKIEVTTVYNSTVAGALFERKFPFLHVKKYGQLIYSTFEVKKSSGLKFQDGDGDVFFT